MKWYLDELESLHQPRVFTSAMMMDDGQDLLCCMTCDPPASLEYARHSDSSAWPCDTRELIDGMREKLKAIHQELDS